MPFSSGGRGALDTVGRGETQFSSRGRDTCDARGNAEIQFFFPSAVVHMRRCGAIEEDAIPISRDAVIDAKTAELTGEMPKWEDVIATL